MTDGVGFRSSRGPLLAAMMIASGVAAIDATALATAVPSIVADLGGFAQFPWLFSIYLLTSAVTVPVYAKLADTFGRKPMILFGLAVFLVGSLLCGVAWDMTSLILFRAVQGIGAGAITPITVTMVGDIYTVEERARVQGYMASVWAIASIAGPTLGGAFAQFDFWRGIFFLNVPLCLLAGWMIWTRFSEKVERRAHRIDYAGAALLTASMTLLILGVLQGGHGWAWDSPQSLAVFGSGAALLAAFVVVERRAAEPVLPVWVLSRRLLLTTNLLGFFLGMMLIGLTEFVPTFLTITTGAPPILAGLALGALTFGWPLAAAFAGGLYLRFGFKPTTVLGGVLIVLGSAALAVTSQTPSIVTVAVVCFVIGAGLGFAAVTSLVASQASVEWNERGVVTGTQMFARSIGQALGAAAFGAIANAAIRGLGGDERDPATMTTASGWVFVAVTVAAVLLLAAALLMPRVRHEPAPE